MTTDEVLSKAKEYMRNRRKGSYEQYELLKKSVDGWVENYESFLYKLIKILKI